MSRKSKGMSTEIVDTPLDYQRIYPSLSAKPLREVSKMASFFY